MLGSSRAPSHRPLRLFFRRGFLRRLGRRLLLLLLLLLADLLLVLLRLLLLLLLVLMLLLLLLVGHGEPLLTLPPLVPFAAPSLRPDKPPANAAFAVGREGVRRGGAAAASEALRGLSLAAGCPLAHG